MINVVEARTKSNEAIANIKEQAVRDLMPKINDVIESAIKCGKKKARVVINNEMNEEQKQREEQSLISFIKYNSNEYVISAIVEELKQYGYAASTCTELRMFGRQDVNHMAVDISWAEDNAKS
ncbi:hypothetical protein [Weissella viridescens]|uniref:hypothetical protein n=1 Tax=Weissella viridescens TaxID=1629 RepID=UPI001D09902B|nr:hypothetical protein [Weissella viridescens]MCB6839657.1 hypothetical protein [Weissella viridescens]MCB6846388.1 hypothetical protein [Weissella viridescens]